MDKNRNVMGKLKNRIPKRLRNYGYGAKSWIEWVGIARILIIMQL